MITGARCRAGAVLVALSALLAACGFQLRGTQPVSLALQPLALACGEVPANLCKAVTEQLKLNDVDLAPRSDADYVLQLDSFARQRRASAITTSAAAAEYTLRHSVALQIITADQIPLIEPVTLTTSETYRYDETNVLAKRREESALEEQLTSRLAQQILFRLVPLTESRIQSMRGQHRQNSGEESVP